MVVYKSEKLLGGFEIIVLCMSSVVLIILKILSMNHL